MTELAAGLIAVFTHLVMLLASLVVSPFLTVLHLCGVIEMD